MNATRTLVRNDLRWALPLGIIGLLVHLGPQLSEGLRDPWIYPMSDWAAVSLTFYVFAATFLGLVAVMAEEVTRTREFLLHRPLSFARLFWTRHALGLAVLTAWIVLTPALHLVAFRLFSNEAPLEQPGRWWSLVGQGLPAYLFYALGVFTAAAARSYWGAALLTAAAGAAVAGYLLVSMFLAQATTGLMVMVGSVLVAPLLLVAAYHCQRQGRDPDRPWQARRLAIAGPALVLLAMLIGVTSLTFVHFGAVVGLHESYPRVSRHEGAYILRRWDPEAFDYFQTDAQHRPVRRLPDSANDEPTVWSPSIALAVIQGRSIHGASFPGMGKWYGGRQVVSPFNDGRRRVFASSDGHVYVYRLAARDGEGADRPWRRQVGKGPGNQPFSADTKIISEHFDKDAILLEGDGSVWTYDVRGDAPAFVRQDLPGGDKYLATDRYRAYIPAKQRFARINAFPLVVIGERGRYAYEEGTWTSVPVDAADASDAAIRLEPEVRFEEAGRMYLTLKDREGRQVFSHHYVPRTLGEKSLALLATAPSLLRPPVTTLPSALVSVDAAYRPPGGTLLGQAGGRLLLDPAIMLGSRTALVGNLLLTLLLAGYTFVRLRRLGLPSGRRGFWVVAVLLGGFPAFVCGRLLETDRAWQGVVKAPEAKAAPARLLLTT